MDPLQTPRVFSDRYELTHLIARGGMAEVYRAHDRKLDRPVALKVLFPELSVDRAFVERFRREAQAAANLSHPNIVPVFDWGEDAGTYFIVMEFVDGRPLSAMLRAAGPLAPTTAAEIGAHVAAALAYAHRHGVVHRDVKPGNVLITDDGQVKVTDFGIARAVNTEESLTQTGAVMGTAAYFSPEQAEGIGVGPRSDVYSLGVVLFEMVAGRTPFTGDTPVAVASKHVRDLPPLPSALNPAVPPGLEAVIMKAMAKSPDRRYETADDLRADLVRFGAGRPVVADAAAVTLAQDAATTRVVGGADTTQAVPLPAGAVGPPPGGEAARRRRTRRWIALAILLVVVLAIVVVLLLRSLGYLGGGFALPNVIGQPVAKATATLHAEGLEVSRTQASSTRPVGTVVSTQPDPGSNVSSGQVVTLVVSEGKAPALVTVPLVKGQQLSAAQQLLSQHHLRSQVTSEQSTTAAAGTVLRQFPGAGEQAHRNDRIHLWVATSPTSAVVPKLVGLDQVAAGSAIRGAGLSVGNVTFQCSNSVDSGLVASSNPKEGTQTAPQHAVDLVVSNGACPVTVKPVVGETQQQAASDLAAQGFVPAVVTTTACDPAKNGTVLSQNPSGGASAPPKSSVTLTVCSATAPTTPSSTAPPTSSTTTTSTTTTTTTTTTH